MSNYALVSNGVVVNIADWDGVSEWNPPGIDEKVLFSEAVAIGSTYNGNSFVRPPESFLTGLSHYEWQNGEWVAVMREGYSESTYVEPEPEPDYEVE